MSGDIHDWTPEEEEDILNQIAESSKRYQQYREVVSEPLGLALDDLLLVAPNVDPQLLADVAQSTADGLWDIDSAANFVLELQDQELQILAQEEQAAEQQNQGSNWFERLVKKPTYDKIKAASRLGMASLQFIPDSFNNAWSRGVQGVNELNKTIRGYGDDPRAGTPNYVAPQTGFFEGWFSSTELGQWASGKDMGEGFFLSGEAKQAQEAEALRYRGGVLERVDIPEHTVWNTEKQRFELIPKQRTGTVLRPMSFGRSVGMAVSDPGSREYHLISGAFDFGLQAFAPAAPGAKLAGLKTGRAVEKIGVADKVLYRGMNGLRNMGTPYINRGRVNAWLDSRAGRNFTEVIQNTDNYSDMRRILPNIDVSTAARLVDEAVDPVSTRRVLEEEMGFATGFRSTQDVNWSRWSSVKQNVFRNPVSRTVGLERGAARRPGTELAVGLANDVEKTRTVKDIEDWLVIAKIPVEDTVDAAGNVTKLGRKSLMNRVMRSLSTDPGDTYGTLGALKDVFVEAFASMGLPGRMIKETFESFEETLTMVNRFGDITAQGAVDLHALGTKQILAQATGDGRWATVRTPDDFGMAFLDSEHLRHNLHMPPPDEIIRATSPYRWLFEAGSVSRSARRRITSARTKNLTPEEIMDLEENWVTWMNGGKLRSGLAVLDFVQNSVFKRLVLMSQAYINRALIESMARQSFAPGIRGGVQHPFETITAAVTNQKIGTHLGSLEGDLWRAADQRFLDDAYTEYIEGTNAVIAGEIAASNRSVLSWQANAWASRVPGDPEFLKAFQDNIFLLSNDRLTRVYAEFGVDEIIKRAKAGDKEVVQALKDLEYRLTSSKWVEVDAQGNPVPIQSGEPQPVWKPKFFDPQGNLIEGAVRQHIESYVGSRYRKFTKGNPELEEIIRNGADGGRFVDPATGKEAYAFIPYEVSSKMTRGAVGSYGDEFTKIVNGLPPDHFPPVMKGRVTIPVRQRAPGLDPRTTKVMQMYDTATTFFFRQLAGRTESWLNRSPVFRKYYHYSVDALLDDLAPGESIKILGNMDLAYRSEVSRELTLLERSTQLSNGSYKVGNKVVSAARYERRLASAQKKMAKLDQWRPTPSRPYSFDPRWGARYVGSKELFNDIVGKSTGKLAENGTRTLEEVSTASKGFALSETQRLLYDVSSASNMAEAFTIISPFVKAWQEGITAWPKRLLMDPARTRRLGIAYQGLEETDLDGDGRGLIYKDPVTGKPVFSLPLGDKSYMIPAAISSGALAAVGSVAMGGPAGLPFVLGATGAAGVLSQTGVPGTNVPGVQPELTYDVQSLNMGLQSVGPGLGSTIQMALGEASKYVPMDRDFLAMLMPYGVPEGNIFSSNIPSWLKKVAEVVSVVAGGDGGKFMTQYTVEAKSALQMTGKYDTRDEQSMRELDKDAQSMALGLLLVHTAAQFQGPARPDVELIVPTQFEGTIEIDDVEAWFDSNVPLRYLGAEFRRLQEEDYTNAVKNFINLFGSDAYLVMAGGSKANVEGLSATKEFGRWMDDNKDIMDAVPTMYGWYAGDVGTEFDGWTYNQLILRGDRVRFDDPEMQEQSAQVIIARAIYQEAVRAAGINPDIAQQMLLRALKTDLEDRYPMWAASERTLGENQQMIEQIRNDVFELDVLEDNEVAMVARQYFEIRDEAIKIADAVRVERGSLQPTTNPLSGKEFAPLRARLRLAGFLLSDTYPGFERMWNDVLFREVDVTYDEEQ